MFILADIGGTKTRIAGSVDLKSFAEPIILSTPREYSAGLTAIHAAAKQIAMAGQIDSMAAGIKSVVFADKRVPITAPQNILTDWKDKPLAADLEKLLETPSVQLENDTALVGLGEAVYGAGKGFPIVVYQTVSTGVNGVRITSGRIDSSAQGFEIGGQYLSMSEPLQNLESLVSGTAVTARFGKHPKDLGADHPVWEELARITAFGVHNTILHWSPDIVVLGGSMFNEVGISVERVAENVKTIMRKFPKVPPIVHGSLGDFGGLWGGLALLNQRS
ncbi:ROK family protein [Candidatus Kaiserbacteria bacterium]|nr:ROK family protein [Candidatus Kaiserbacteria bacterium]